MEILCIPSFTEVLKLDKDDVAVFHTFHRVINSLLIVPGNYPRRIQPFTTRGQPRRFVFPTQIYWGFSKQITVDKPAKNMYNNKIVCPVWAAMHC